MLVGELVGELGERLPACVVDVVDCDGVEDEPPWPIGAGDEPGDLNRGPDRFAVTSETLAQSA
jgi:hypothetical protein